MNISTNQLTRETMTFVLAGGRHGRLKELTDIRAKPAVYFGGKSRIIDFALFDAVTTCHLHETIQPPTDALIWWTIQQCCRPAIHRWRQNSQHSTRVTCGLQN